MKFRNKKILTDDNIFNFFNIFLICLFVFIVAYPLLYVIFASVSSGAAVDTGRVTFFPVDFTLSAYREIATDMQFWRSYFNSVLMVVLGTGFSMIITLTGGYALSKRDLPGHRIFNFLVMFTMWFSAGMIPTFLNLQRLNLLNFAGLIIGFGVIIFNVIIIRSAYYSVPQELQEAAKIDGASEFKNFWHIATPSIKPAIAVVALQYGIVRWNGFFWAMIAIRELEWMPLQVYLRRMIIERQLVVEEATFILAEHSHQTMIYAVIVCSIIPIFIVFPFMQKVFKRGILEGGLKG